MLRLASDADVHGGIIRGLRRRCPEIDLVRVQDVLAESTLDVDVLDWAAEVNRILITNDRSTMIGFAYRRLASSLRSSDDGVDVATMIGFAYRRLASGDSVPGLIATTNEQSIGAAIEDILLIAEYMRAEEIRDQVVLYLPFKG